MAYRRLQPDDEIKGDYFAHNKVYDSAARFTSVACAVIVAVFDVLALGNVVKSPAVPFLVAIVLEIVLGFSVAIFFTGVFNKKFNFTFALVSVCICLVVIAAPVIYRKEYAEFITPAYKLTDKEQTEKAGITSVETAEKQYRRDSLAIARGMAAEIKAVTHKISKEKRVIPAKWKPEYQEAVSNNRRVSSKITAAVSEIKADYNNRLLEIGETYSKITGSAITDRHSEISGLIRQDSIGLASYNAAIRRRETSFIALTCVFILLRIVCIAYSCFFVVKTNTYKVFVGRTGTFDTGKVAEITDAIGDWWDQKLQSVANRIRPKNMVQGLERRMDIGGVSSLIVTNNTDSNNSPYRYELTGSTPVATTNNDDNRHELGFHYAGKDQVVLVGEKDLAADILRRRNNADFGNLKKQNGDVATIRQRINERFATLSEWQKSGLLSDKMVEKISGHKMNYEKKYQQ
jgi:hypothetical protein